MTIADTYDTGTVSVDSSGNVTGSGVIWSLVKKFDLITIDGGDLRIITEVTDTTHLKIQPWSGTASAKPYVIYYNALLRLTNGELALRTNELVKTITGDGYFVYVAPADSAPDPAKGKDGQYALKPSTGATWLKSSGVWNATGTLGALYPASNLSDVANVATARSNLGILGVPREVLTANRTYYVRTDGSDSNNGLANTSGGAFLTLQKAYDTITANLDLGGQAVTVQIGDGTYTGGLAVSQPWTGGGSVTFQGNNATPANVVISTTSADCVKVSTPLPGVLTIKDLKMQTTTSGSCLNVVAPAIVNSSNVNFGAAGDFHIAAQAPGALIKMTTAYTISGGATTHWLASSGGSVTDTSKTITLSGTPAFSFAVAYATRLGSMTLYGDTFSGTATGTRYSGDTNAVIFTNGAGATYLPGNAAGSTALGAQYV